MNDSNPPGSVLGDYISSLLSDPPRDADGEGSQSEARSGTDVAERSVVVFEGPGIGIAVASESVSEPVAATDCRAPEPGGHDWIVGSAEIDGDICWLIDCDRLIQPSAAATQAQYWLPALHLPIALVARGRPESGTLAHEEIVWRGSEGTRPWLAGTATASQRVLIDIGGIASLLPVDSREDKT